MSFARLPGAARSWRHGRTHARPENADLYGSRLEWVIETEQSTEDLAQKNLKLAQTFAILSLVLIGVCIAFVIVDGSLFSSSDDWRTIIIIASAGGIAPMVLVIVFTGVARAQIARDFKLMLGMSIPCLALAGFATAIAVSGIIQLSRMVDIYSEWLLDGYPEYAPRLALNALALAALCGAAAMNALQIPLGIKDVIIGAETIQAARSKSGTAGFYSPQPAPAAAPTIAAPAAGGPFCSKCGAKNDAGARFCNKCGAAMG